MDSLRPNTLGQSQNRILESMHNINIQLKVKPIVKIGGASGNTLRQTILWNELLPNFTPIFQIGFKDLVQNILVNTARYMRYCRRYGVAQPPYFIVHPDQYF